MHVEIPGVHDAECRSDQPEAVKENLVSALVKGFASHHAGLLPGWKGIVESLFQQGEAPCYA